MRIDVIPATKVLCLFVMCALSGFMLLEHFLQVTGSHKKYWSNYTALCLAILFWPALVNITVKTHHIAVIWLVTCGLLSLTSGQTALLALIIGGGAFFLTPYISRPVFHGIFGIIALLIISLPWVAPFLYQKTLPYTLPHQIGERLEIWAFVSEKIQTAPITGHGFDSTPQIRDFNLKHHYYTGKAGVWQPHNGFLELWIDFGLWGIVASLALLWFIFTKIHVIAHNTSLYKTSVATCITCLSVIFVGYGLWHWWLWLSIAVSVGLIYLNNRSTKL